jgi:hypothetical protein
MKKTILLIVFIIILAGAGYWVWQSGIWGPAAAPEQQEQKVEADPKNATYTIEGKDVALLNGQAQTEAAPGSALKIITQYFGNEVKADFNGDGVADVAFLLTQDAGGTGTFYYVAAVISENNGYKGTNAILLGDRIAPQTTEFRNGMIIVNYADRKPGEPFTTPPSVGVSKYFKVVDGKIIAIDLKIGEAEARTIAEKSCIKGGEALGEGSYNENSETWWFDANLNTTKEGCNPACVVSAQTKTAEINWRCTGLIVPNN